MIEPDVQNGGAASTVDDAVAQPAQTAGQMIRAAREQWGVPLHALAANLKVSVHKLEALEANDWSAFPDVVFTRALASTVCRVLKMDAGPVLDLLPKAPGHSLSRAGEGINAKVSGGTVPRKSGDFASSKPFPWMGVVALLIVASAGVLFYPQWAERWKQSADAAAPAPVARASNVAGVMEGAEPVPLGASSTGADAEVAASGAQVPGVAALPVPVQAPAAAATETAAANAPLLKVKTTQDSWVQVKESAGTVVFEQTIKAGSEQDIAAKPPLKIVVGNASGVELWLRGEPFDLKKVIKGSIARFEVN